MNSEQQERVHDLFELCRLLPESDQDARLSSIEGRDQDVVREVRSLLDAYNASPDFLNMPAFEAYPGISGQALRRPVEAQELTERDEPWFGKVDRYQLFRKIGEGGMGEVWFAEQTDAVRRNVAIKVLKSGGSSREVITRFESERQALAMMDHPGIARVFDAGTTTRGVPYCAMEFVDGVPITEYAECLPQISQRLELFRLVCEAVQHAHQKAIIHRDLKPSNILVTKDGAPKVIDFGIAKALTRKLTMDTLQTRAGTLVGTPEYMSPEQAGSLGQNVDTRSDVYSLGVVLYELVAGVVPQTGHDLPFDEFLRRLREEDVRKPSSMVSSGRAKELRGDLDSIALKALEKDPSRRYSSPADLAADLERHLKQAPVLAMPPSPAYKAGKFARRHKIVIATATIATVALMGAAFVTVRASLRASREAASAEAVNDFLRNDVLAQASTLNQNGIKGKPDPDLKVRTALDRAAERLGGKFERQPEIEAAIRETIGQSYLDLGLFPQARTQFERALELHRRISGDQDPATAITLSRLGSVALLQGKYPDAEKAFTEALAVQRRSLGPNHPETLRAMSGLASSYRSQAKYAQALSLQTQSLEISRRVLGPEHAETLREMNSLGIVYSALGRYKDAEATDSQIVTIRRRVFGPEYPTTLYAITNLAYDYMVQDKYAEAEVLLASVTKTERQMMGTANSATLHSMNFLANTFYFQGRYAEAEALHKETLENMRAVLGPEHLDSLTVASNLARDNYAQRKFAPAEALLTDTLNAETRMLAKDHPVTLFTRSVLAGLFQEWGRYGKAEDSAVQTLEARRRVLGPQHLETMQSVADLALIYIAEKKFSQSEPLAREALEFHRRTDPDGWRLFRDEVLLGASLTEGQSLLKSGFDGLAARQKQIPAPEGHRLEALKTAAQP